MNSLIEVWNALTMLPYAYISFNALYLPIRLFATWFWVSSFIYHMLQANNKMLAARGYYMSDCLGQILLIISLAYYTPCYDSIARKTIFLIGGLGAISILLFYEDKKYALAAVCAVQIVNFVFICMYSCNKNTHLPYIITYALLAFVAMLVSDIPGNEWIWPIGHLFTFLYTVEGFKGLLVL